MKMQKILINLVIVVLYILINERIIMKIIILLTYLFLSSIFDIRFKKIPPFIIFLFCICSITFDIYNHNIISLFSFIPGAIMLIISLISEHSLGLGDCLIFFSLGLLLSLYEILLILLFALFFVSLIGIFIFLIRRDKKQSLPFVPFIFLSCTLLLFL